MSDANDKLVSMLLQVMLTGKGLKEKGVWIKQDYADRLLDVFAIVDGRAQVCDILALTDDITEGISWPDEFFQAVVDGLAKAQGMEKSEMTTLWATIRNLVMDI